MSASLVASIPRTYRISTMLFDIVLLKSTPSTCITFCSATPSDSIIQLPLSYINAPVTGSNIYLVHSYAVLLVLIFETSGNPLKVKF
jgi:hypothetical protein